MRVDHKLDEAPDTAKIFGLSPGTICRRLQALAKVAGIETPISAHSFRIGPASELTARCAPLPK